MRVLRRRRPGVPGRLAALMLICVLSVSSCSARNHIGIDQSSPRNLVVGYMAALMYGDTESVLSVLTPDSVMRGSTWLGSPPNLSDIEIGEPRVPGQEVPPQKPVSAQVMEVPVSFDISNGEKDGFTSGPNSWGYTVVRQSSAEPWLISQEGTG